MKLSLASVGALLLPAAVEGHYIFNILIVNGQQIGGEYTYFRKNSNSYNPVFPDIISTPEMRCNKGVTTGGSTKTYSVKAGDRIAGKLFFNEFIEHPGPGFVYMSKAPGSVSSYDGSGDWFKVWHSGLCGSNPPKADTDWCTWQKDRMEFTIPPKTPPGEYLVRFEHIGLHQAHEGKAQLYMECLQLNITGSGGGTPGPLVKIPGIYSTTDPGIKYDKWYMPKVYTIPGPAVWNGN